MEISECSIADADDWAQMRHDLWPESTIEEHRRDIDRVLANPQKYASYIARENTQATGFAEASLRHDYVNGCDTSPVVFLEGIYTKPTHRHHSVARALCAYVESWGATNHCTEFASDALLHNNASHQMHEALGFQETERVVYFRKQIKRGQ